LLLTILTRRHVPGIGVFLGTAMEFSNDTPFYITSLLGLGDTEFTWYVGHQYQYQYLMMDVVMIVKPSAECQLLQETEVFGENFSWYQELHLRGFDVARVLLEPTLRWTYRHHLQGAKNSELGVTLVVTSNAIIHNQSISCEVRTAPTYKKVKLSP
jgi:hypothetical protein